MTRPLPLVRGTLDALILKALGWGPMHGLEIAGWLGGRSDGLLAVEESALYQGLRRLEERRLVVADWGVTQNSRRARYYSLTDAGRDHLRGETMRWVRYAKVVTEVLTSREAPITF